MENLRIYEKVRNVPLEAQKEIKGGRLKGMTDINPMWRIKILTEQFGPVGFGWKYEIVERWTERGGNDEISAFIRIKLYYKKDGEWGEPIEGIGGSSFVTKEKNGFYTSDECYKMALTDAISVACKAIGIGADVYWDRDKSKYDKEVESKNESKGSQPTDKRRVVPIDDLLSDKFLQALHDLEKKSIESGKRTSPHAILEKNYILTTDEIKNICLALGDFEKRTNQVLMP